jgi:hypothetical protein
MWTHDQARTVVDAYVQVVTDCDDAILDQSTLDKPYGWVFFYSTKRFVETGDPRDGLVGNAPLIFNRVTGKYRVADTAHPIEHYLNEYEAQLPAFMLEMNPQLRMR